MLTIVHQGFVVAGVVALIVLACFHQETKAAVWRVCFGLGIVVSNHSLVADDFSANQQSYHFRSSFSDSAWSIQHSIASMPLNTTFHICLH
jgi:hypothetical protein